MRHQPPENLGEFPTTHWSLVGRAGSDDLAAKRQALEQLLTRYMSALRAHLVLRKRLSPDRADDVLQSFLASKILEQGIIARAEREKGRFRNFLMVALDRFHISEIRREQAMKRRPDGLVAIDEDPDMVRSEPAADTAFDVAWARQLLGEAIRRMEAACQSPPRPDVWGVFQTRILRPTLGQGEEESYESLVRRYGFTSPAQASNVLMTAKRMFIRTLRSMIGEYEKNEEDIDAEIADLFAILSQSSERGTADERPDAP
jgi:RNA polymerase sigma-70 factor (ECF subfamily)